MKKEELSVWNGITYTWNDEVPRTLNCVTIHHNGEGLLPITPYEIIDNNYSCCNQREGIGHNENCPNRLANRVIKNHEGN